MQRRGAKSFVDDLVLSRGVVLSRAAASLRSIETKPFDWLICPLKTDTSANTQSRKAGLFSFLGAHGSLHICGHPSLGWPLIFFEIFLRKFFTSPTLLYTYVRSLSPLF